MQIGVIAIILSAIGVILVAASIITTGYWMSRAVRAIYDDTRAGLEKNC